ncbi:MAG TPA: hypothetical protein VGR51_08140 [Thermoplasmata archaeon]|jgi:hypothetical protein|nr:hypothetical protein [Thermoplasmata archaeon]
MIESEARPARAGDATPVAEGDRVRLKFLYPNGAIEVLECTWIATSSLGAPENPNGGWVVVSAEERVLWKPLSHLIQLEVLEVNEEARHLRRTNGAGFDHYR